MKYLNELLSGSSLNNILFNMDENIAEEFKNFKVKFNEVSKKITLLEQTNVELIKHGLTMSNKVLDIIIQACTPQSTGYDCHGKNSQGSGMGISSVCEDA